MIFSLPKGVLDVLDVDAATLFEAATLGWRGCWLDTWHRSCLAPWATDVALRPTHRTTATPSISERCWRAKFRGRAFTVLVAQEWEPYRWFPLPDIHRSRRPQQDPVSRTSLQGRSNRSPSELCVGRDTEMAAPAHGLAVPLRAWTESGDRAPELKCVVSFLRRQKNLQTSMYFIAPVWFLPFLRDRLIV